MFTGEMSESKQNIVNIKEVDADALELLIEYCYTAEVKVTEENVQVIIKSCLQEMLIINLLHLFISLCSVTMSAIISVFLNFLNRYD